MLEIVDVLCIHVLPHIKSTKAHHRERVDVTQIHVLVVVVGIGILEIDCGFTHVCYSDGQLLSTILSLDKTCFSHFISKLWATGFLALLSAGSLNDSW